MDGFFLVDKPKGITSQVVCERVKRKLNLNKVGHTGTLDPSASGVMILAFNKATRLIRLLDKEDKEYITDIVFGYDTDTLDMDGKILKDIPMEFTLEQLKDSIEKVVTQEWQVPPMTSAIHWKGKRLYEYQRMGIELNPEPRKVKVISYAILSDLKFWENHWEIRMSLKVEKGYYIRSFARDLGKMLGGCAVVKELRRIKIGNFSIEQAKPIEEITLNDGWKIEDVFSFPRLEVNDYIAKLVRNGVTLDNRQGDMQGDFFVTNNCDIIAVYETVEPLQYKPVVILK